MVEAACFSSVSRVPGASLFPMWLLSTDGSGRSAWKAASPDRSPGQETENCVMVVEDEADAREAMVELIEQEGVGALGARHGREALDLLQAGRRPSLILLDLKMPVMDGWAFCDALGADERFASIPVAILTASAIYESLPHRRNGAGLFTKPVDFQRLLALVRRFCG
jgi:two-component system response regulator MprA